MTARTVPLLVLVVLLAPLALAAPNVASLESARIEASGATTTASLQALEQLGGTASLRLSATAIDAVLEQESAETQLNNTPQGGGYVDQGPQEASYADVTSAQSTLRPRHEIYVLALPGSPPPQATVIGTCATVMGSDRAFVRPTSDRMHASGPINRHKERVDTTAALAWNSSACPDQGWLVEGAFLLTLWEADLSFDHAAGTAAYTTGAQYPPEVAPRVSLSGNRTNRLLYLTVHGGHLELEGTASAYFADATIRADAIVLRGATGDIPAFEQAAALAGDDVELRGDLEARVTHTGQALDVDVTGTLEGGTIGGYSLVVASGGGPTSTTWWAALAVIPVLVGGGAAALRRRPARALARLAALGLAGRHDAVAKRARDLQGVPELAGEATALRMEALARSGRPGAALDQARRLPPMEAALATAYIYAVSGDVPACVVALRTCATLDPGWMQLALRDPVFAVARRDPSLLRLVARSGAEP